MACLVSTLLCTCCSRMIRKLYSQILTWCLYCMDEGNFYVTNCYVRDLQPRLTINDQYFICNTILKGIQSSRHAEAIIGAKVHFHLTKLIINQRNKLVSFMCWGDWCGHDLQRFKSAKFALNLYKRMYGYYLLFYFFVCVCGDVLGTLKRRCETIQSSICISPANVPRRRALNRMVVRSTGCWLFYNNISKLMPIVNCTIEVCKVLLWFMNK